MENGIESAHCCAIRFSTKWSGRMTRVSWRDWVSESDCAVNARWAMAAILHKQKMAAAEQILRARVRCLSYWLDYGVRLLSIDRPLSGSAFCCPRRRSWWTATSKMNGRSGRWEGITVDCGSFESITDFIGGGGVSGRWDYGRLGSRTD